MIQTAQTFLYVYVSKK